jgi:hypothetical protein
LAFWRQQGRVAWIIDLQLNSDPYEVRGSARRRQTFDLHRADACHQKIAGPYVSANNPRKSFVKLGIKATLRVAGDEKI